jgi:putative flippase GtrA
MSIYKIFREIYLANSQVIRFAIIGFLCYLIGMVLLIVIVEWLKVEVNLANIISSFITIFICYMLNVKFVFKDGRHSKVKEIIAFYGFSFVGFLINVALMFVMTKYLLIWYVVSKTLVTMLVAGFNFISRKKFVFLQ